MEEFRQGTWAWLVFAHGTWYLTWKPKAGAWDLPLAHLPAGLQADTISWGLSHSAVGSHVS